jgi:hypothetical protein
LQCSLLLNFSRRVWVKTLVEVKGSMQDYCRSDKLRV